RIDHLRALGVVLKRIERPFRLIGGQDIGFVRGRGGGFGRSAGLTKGGKGKQGAGEQDRRQEFVRHEGPFKLNMCRKAEPNRDLPTRMRHVGSSFSPLSCVGSLPPWRLSLGICRIPKMPQRLVAGTFGARPSRAPGAEVRQYGSWLARGSEVLLAECPSPQPRPE